MIVSEYTRLGYWTFWEIYGDAVREIDENLVMPVLTSLAVSIGDKWRWDANDHSFKTKNGTEFHVIFDVSQPPSIFEIEIRKMRYNGYDTVGTVFVRLPQKRWSSLRKQLTNLINGSL